VRVFGHGAGSGDDDGIHSRVLIVVSHLEGKVGVLGYVGVVG
jgi:hypothetical protein